MHCFYLWISGLGKCVFPYTEFTNTNYVTWLSFLPMFSVVQLFQTVGSIRNNANLSCVRTFLMQYITLSYFREIFQLGIFIINTEKGECQNHIDELSRSLETSS